MESKLRLLATSNFEALNPSVQRDIYQEFYKLAYSSIHYMVRDHATTEDIIQESFLKVISNMPPDIDGENKLRSWIKVVVKNTTLNFLRKNKNHRNEIDSESVYMYDNLDLSTDSSSIEKEIELKVLSAAIKKCLRTLKPDYQLIMELRWHRQLSYKEIAEQLGATEEYIKSKLHRAREAIRKTLEKEWGEPR